MADVKWIKIVTDIFDDEKILLIESMPEADGIIVIWFKLLCLAGRQNNSGVFMMNGRIPYTDEMFATIFRRPLNTVRLALKTFETYGMIEIINETVTIPNWGKHQTLDQIERNREYMKNYMRKRREEQRLLVEGELGCKSNSKVNGKSNVNGADKNREDKKREEDTISRKRDDGVIHPGFDDFWSVYPRKVAKQTAVKAWGKTGANDSQALTDTIIADVKRRVDSEWKGKDVQYIPHPSTYLNQRRWEDETAPTERKEASHRGIDPKDNPALDYQQREYKDEDYGENFYIDLDKYGEE